MKPTREQVKHLVKKSGIATYGLGYTAWEGQLERFAALASEAGAAAEREECAKLVEGINPDHQDCNHYDRFIAAAIRARGEK
jgi:hypothetical protein